MVEFKREIGSEFKDVVEKDQFLLDEMNVKSIFASVMGAEKSTEVYLYRRE